MNSLDQKNKKKYYIEGIGLLTGLIIGAGIFALPYSIYKAGLFWGFLHFGIALFLMLVIHFLYGEVAYLTDGKHRFPGYVSMYLGKKSGIVASFFVLLGYYGSLLAYGILAGLFLNNIFGGFMASPDGFAFSVAFFVAGSVISILRFDKIGTVNFYLTAPLLLFILYLIINSFHLINFANFNFDFSFSDYWFMPYGIWLFALGGFSVLPDVRDVMRETSLRDFKNVIFISIMIAAIFSMFFALGVLGITGDQTSEDALFGLKSFLGSRGILMGSIIGFLAVATSYLAMIADLKEIFKADFGIHRSIAWALAILPPAAAFVFGISGLISILSIVGAVGLGVSGVFILEMSDRIRKKEATMSRIPKFFKWILGIGIVLGAIYELFIILIK